MCDHAMRHAGFPNSPRQTPGVHAQNAWYLMSLQPPVERSECPIIRRIAGIGPHDDTADRGIDQFDVFVVCSDNANVRKGERDNLARVKGSARIS